MRYLLILLLFVFGLKGQTQNKKSAVLKQFISDIMIIDTQQLNQQQPILTINTIAQTKADKSIVITRENINAALLEARKYRNCLISVNGHTLIRVTNFNDLSPSGAWHTAMPLCKAYIQRLGVLHEKTDYLKNVIGRPDSQIRTMYLFN